MMVLCHFYKEIIVDIFLGKIKFFLFKMMKLVFNMYYETFLSRILFAWAWMDFALKSLIWSTCLVKILPKLGILGANLCI